MMSRLVLATVATEFLSRPGYAASTLKSYELALLPLLQQQGQLPVELLSRGVLEDYLNSLEHLSYTTHRRHQAILQSLLNFAVERGYLRNNPIAHLRQRKPDAQQGESLTDELVRYLSPEQVQQMYLLVKRDLRLHALVSLLHRSGARISEILSLDLEAVDLVGRRFQVVGKGNKKRWCFYSPDAGTVLERYIHNYRHSDCAALFTAQQPMTGVTSRLSYTSVYKAWKKLTQDDDLLKGVRLHDLRHTFATERVGLMGIEELRALLGHQHIQTTLRYQKVTSARAEEVAVQALDKLLSKESVSEKSVLD